MPQGYYRSPSIHGETIVFVSEDDLWSVPASGGRATRLTAGLGEVFSPSISPDGKWIAFCGLEEGPNEAYLMPATGGPARRLTFGNASMGRVAGWTPDSKNVLYASNAQQPIMRIWRMAEVPLAGGLPRELPYGHAVYLAHGPHGAKVVGRYGTNPAYWKRYHGGTAGTLLIDPTGRGEFRQLVELNGNLSSPMWIGPRVYFLSDHEGHGNLYSCRTDGHDVRRHTDHEAYYARNAATDQQAGPASGRRIVYHAGGDLFVWSGEKSRRVEVDLPSPRTQTNRKYVDPGAFLEDYAPSETQVALTARGRLFAMPQWEGPVREHGAPRTRLARWLHDGKRLVAVEDASGEESLVVLPGGKRVRAEVGRAIELIASPKTDQVAVINHRYELLVVDLKSGRARILDRSRHDRIAGAAWSPDGAWIAYSLAESYHVSVLKLVEVRTGETHVVARPVLRDVAPSFDPDGRFLYFLAFREFDPVYDKMAFDLGFPRGMRPYLVTLRKDLRSPFEQPPKPVDPKAKKEKFHIDLDGIQDRVVAFPVEEGIYDGITGIPGAVLWTTWPVEGSLNQQWRTPEPPTKGTLEKFDLAKKKREPLTGGVSSFRVGGGLCAIRCGKRLRLVKAGDKPEEKGDANGRESGWVDLTRARVLVEPRAEWGQMFRESWRLMRDHFWVPDMSGVDWEEVHDRYRPLLDRVASRSEFSDVMWEVQGELGTSHCYEIGGDYRRQPRYDVGLLGADFAWSKRGWRVTRLHRGDGWREGAGSPLCAPGVNARVGDVIVAIQGKRVSRAVTPHEQLLHCAGAEVLLKFANGREATVRALRDETAARYREWVEANRRQVHEATRGRVGYIHVPDMGAPGYAEFHRAYLAEVDREGLIVDVRFNGGGHVSPLLLEKLARRRLGYDVNRWGQPFPYPNDSPAGPLVALTNESAGSDGDIFSHCFKLLGLGPLIGKRTWGGVVGIWPRHFLADGSITTQPEFAFWFRDVGFGVENYGTDPDIEVDILPQDIAKGRDPQMEKGIEVVLELLKKHKPLEIDLKARARLGVPALPRRK